MISSIRRFIAVTSGFLITLFTLGFVRIDTSGAYNKTEYDHEKKSAHTRSYDGDERE
jgi:hypothetical protein